MEIFIPKVQKLVLLLDLMILIKPIHFYLLIVPFFTTLKKLTLVLSFQFQALQLQ